MRYWITNIALLAGLLLIVGMLPALGSAAAATLGGFLAIGTLSVGCLIADEFAHGGLGRLKNLLQR